MKKIFLALTLALLAFSFLVPMAAPQADAQGFARADTVVTCGFFDQCYTTICQSSPVWDCSGFQQCPC